MREDPNTSKCAIARTKYELGSASSECFFLCLVCCKPPRNPVTRLPQNIRKPLLTKVYFSTSVHFSCSGAKADNSYHSSRAILRTRTKARIQLKRSYGKLFQHRIIRSRAFLHVARFTRPSSKREISFSVSLRFPNREKPATRPREARHDGADRHIRSLGDLAIGQPMKIS
jgi:hypothetical protein